MFRVLCLVALAGSSACGATWQNLPTEAPAKIRYVQEPCTVPAIETPRIPPEKCGEDGSGWVCYDRYAARLLDDRLAEMRRWIETARKRCVMEYLSSDVHLVPPYRRASLITQQPARLSAIPR